MKYRKLGHTDIDLSLICLGTMTWGTQNTEPEAHAQLDYALEQGINFIDTAELYPVPPKQELYGRTESYIGSWLAADRSRRSKLFIATKVTGPGEFVKYIRNGPRLNKEHIQRALESSLKRLQTDYIDLYQLHWPERKTNFFGQLGYSVSPEWEGSFVPIAISESLEFLAELVRDGKIRYIGISNETPWGVHEFLRLSKEHNWPRLVSIQNPYNLLNRSFEVGLAEMAYREKVGLLAYSPLGFGALSGKYLKDAESPAPASARLNKHAKRYDRYTNELSTKATQAYVGIARKHGLDPAQMALAFVNSRPFLTSNIIGASSLAQLEMNSKSIALELSDEVLQEIAAIHKLYPNPAP